MLSELGQAQGVVLILNEHSLFLVSKWNLDEFDL